MSTFGQLPNLSRLEIRKKLYEYLGYYNAIGHSTVLTLRENHKFVTGTDGLLVTGIAPVTVIELQMTHHR